MLFEQVLSDVRNLLNGDNSGHGTDHVERVYALAMKLSEGENVNQEIVALAALLHDVDDYKLFGDDNAKNLINAKRIMQQNRVDEQTSAQVCDIIAHMGYSKCLQGVRPQSKEGKIVSDADMLEAIGAVGTIRCLAYALAKCHSGTDQVFDRNVWPEINLSAEEYKKPNRKSDNFINHFFEKMLKIKDLMMTDAGKKEAYVRHQFMLDFLYEFFRENDCPDWIDFLEKFGNKKS